MTMNLTRLPFSILFVYRHVQRGFLDVLLDVLVGRDKLWRERKIEKGREGLRERRRYRERGRERVSVYDL